MRGMLFVLSSGSRRSIFVVCDADDLVCAGISHVLCALLYYICDLNVQKIGEVVPIF
jgi:hypothetical protein